MRKLGFQIPTFKLYQKRASANRFYIAMHEALNNTILLTSRHLHQAQPERDADATFERHRAIFEAVRDGDGVRAQAAMATRRDQPRLISGIRSANAASAPAIRGSGRDTLSRTVASPVSAR